MSHARDEKGTNARVEEGANRQTDQFGNQIPQPSTTIMYGPPSAEGGAIFGMSTGDAEAFKTNFYGGQLQEDRPPGGPRAPPGTDPTRRRGTTTGEYGTAGIGLMDLGKEKVHDIGGFKEDFGHVSTTGEPMETNKRKLH